MSASDPDLSLAGFGLWLHGDAYPTSEEAWTQDLIEFSVRLDIRTSTIRDEGVLSKAALALFNHDLARMLETLDGKAVLEAGEASIMLVLSLSMKSLGRVQMDVDIRAYDGTERHQVEFELDQSYLEPFARQVRAAVATCPSRLPIPQKLAAVPSGFGSRLLDAVFGRRIDPD